MHLHHWYDWAILTALVGWQFIIVAYVRRTRAFPTREMWLDLITLPLTLVAAFFYYHPGSPPYTHGIPLTLALLAQGFRVCQRWAETEREIDRASLKPNGGS